MKWFGHVARMKGDKLVKQILTRRILAIMQRGRRRIKWLLAMEMEANGEEQQWIKKTEEEFDSKPWTCLARSADNIYRGKP